MALNTRFIIALQQISGYGSKTIKALAEKSKEFGIETPQELCEFVNSLISDGLIPRVKKLIDIDELTEAINKADWILEKSEDLGIKCVSYLEPDFPQNLLKTVNEEGKPDVPILLYYKGDLSITKQKAVAIIGTREPTQEGVRAGEYYGEKFAQEGYNIVSGLAIGCDTAGHKGALKAGGVTTSFLAHGLDMVYPPENTDLAQAILDGGGLLMSEYPIGTNVNRYNLVARDRLQAALADATIVIQTGIRGGTLHASNTTLISGKPLFCVKFTNLSNHEKTQGNNLLVSKGAQYLSSDSAITTVAEAITKPLDSEIKTPTQQTLFDL